MKRLSLNDPPFNAGTGRGVTVAVVDSGIHAEHPHIGRRVVGGVCLLPAADPNDWVDRIGHGTAVAAEHGAPQSWRMPPLAELPLLQLTLLNRTWLIVLRGYLVIAAGLVLVRIAQLVTVHQ